MSRRRKVLIALGAFVAIVAGAVAASVPYIKEKIRTEAQARCAAVVGGTCTFGAMQYARDGVMIADVRVENTATGATAQVGRVGVQLRWWPLLLGNPQGASVHAVDVGLASDHPVDELLAEVRRLRDARGGGTGRASRVRVDRLVIERLNLRSSVGFLMSVAMDNAAGEWARDGALTGHWAEATLEAGPLTTGRTGACVFHRDRGAAQLVLDCDGFTTQVEVDTADDRAAAVRALLRAFRSRPRAADARGGRAGSADGESRAAALGLGGITSVLLRGRGGAITVTRNARPVVARLPATFEIQIEHGRMTDAHVTLGGDGEGPALEADIATPPGRPWRVDINADGLPLPEVARFVPAIPWHAIDQGRVHARGRIEPGARAGLVALDGELWLERFGLLHAALSRDPIDGLDVRVRGGAEIDLVRGRVSTDGVQIGFNSVVLALAGWAEHSHARTALDASVRLATVSCDAIRRALPRVVTGPVNDLTFAGTLGADVRLALDTTNLAATQLDLDVADQCTVFRDGLAQGVRRFGRPFVQRVEEPGGLRAFVAGPGSAAWVSLGELAPAIAGAVLTREDGGFYRHHGFNVREIRGAIIRDVGARRFVYGASTITMQLAKNVFLRREKTLVRKLQEVALAWYLERSLDKDSLLELYLNVVEFGPGVYGIGPAARFYFGREPRDLTPLQSIYLATLLPNPTARYGNFLRGGVTPDTLARLRGIARSMVAQGRLSPAEGEAAQQEVFAFRAAGSAAPARLTQNVDPTMTDAQAEVISRMHARDELATRVDDATTHDGDSESDSDAAPRATDSDEPAQPAVVPVSLRTGGTI